jgi:hypothetical protein
MAAEVPWQHRTRKSRRPVSIRSGSTACRLFVGLLRSIPQKAIMKHRNLSAWHATGQDHGVQSKCMVNETMFAREIRVKYESDGHNLPCPLKSLDSFSIRNFTKAPVFDDTMPVSDGCMEVGTNVFWDNSAMPWRTGFGGRVTGQGLEAAPRRVTLPPLLWKFGTCTSSLKGTCRKGFAK